MNEASAKPRSEATTDPDSLRKDLQKQSIIPNASPGTSIPEGPQSVKEIPVTGSNLPNPATPKATFETQGIEPILLVTATRVETQAILHTFCPCNEWISREIKGRMYYALGRHGEVPVFMSQSEMGTGTPGGSALTVQAALEAFNPQAVIMCGIAFGLRPEKGEQKLGDILISEQLVYYEPQKVENEAASPRGDRVKASISLLGKFRRGDLKWGGPRRHIGLMLSGEKLVNDADFIQQLRKLESRAIGGDMEGAGLYAAAVSYETKKVAWILVKGICDWADGTKNDGAQELAAINAAQFVRFVISLGDWKVKTHRQTQKPPVTVPAAQSAAIAGAPADQAPQPPSRNIMETVPNELFQVPPSQPVSSGQTSAQPTLSNGSAPAQPTQTGGVNANSGDSEGAGSANLTGAGLGGASGAAPFVPTSTDLVSSGPTGTGAGGQVVVVPPEPLWWINILLLVVGAAAGVAAAFVLRPGLQEILDRDFSYLEVIFTSVIAVAGALGLPYVLIREWPLRRTARCLLCFGSGFWVIFTALMTVFLINGIIIQPDCSKLTVNVNLREGGRVKVDPSYNCRNDTYKNNDTVLRLTPVANPGYSLMNWIVNGEEVADSGPLTISIKEDLTVTANFAPTGCYPLNLITEPPDGGKVEASPPPASNCPANLYPKDTVVKLTATASPNFRFVAWNEVNVVDETTDNKATARVVMTSQKLVKATFVGFKCRALMISRIPPLAGTVEAAPPPNCQGSGYNPNTEVILKAVPGGDYQFDEWTGDTTGEVNPVPIMMSGDKAVTAVFKKRPCYTLELAPIPNDGGTVNANPSPNCGERQYQQGTVVMLTEAPGPEFSFAKWEGDADGIESSIQVTLSANRRVTAHFTKDQCYTLQHASDPANGGDVVHTPPPNCRGDLYTRGTHVLLNAIVNPGYLFYNWSGIPGTGPKVWIYMTAHRSATANFISESTLLCYTLALASSPKEGGAITASPLPNCNNNTQYREGTLVELRAAPEKRYAFSRWDGDVKGTDNPGQVTMGSSHSVTAVFNRPPCFTLTTSVYPAAKGSVEANPPPNCSDGKRYNEGTIVDLKAASVGRFAFSKWAGDATGTSRSTSVKMDAGRSVTAIFIDSTTLPCYTLTVPPTDGGSVTINTPPTCADKVRYSKGTTVELKAVPTADYEFTDWAGNGAGAANPIQVTMNANQTVSPVFTPLPCYPLSIVSLPEGGGTVERSLQPTCSDGKRYKKGTVVELEAVPVKRQYFIRWTGNAIGTISKTSVTMNGSRSVTAVFSTTPCYTLSVSVNPQNSGKIEASPPNCPDNTGYIWGTVVTLKAIPTGPGSSFTGWSEDASGGRDQTTVTMSKDRSVTANFKQYCYTLNFSSDPKDGGTVTPDRKPNCGDNKYAMGTEVQLSASPNPGFAFSGWSGDARGKDNPYKVKILSNFSAVADFTSTENCFPLTLFSDPGNSGKIDANPAPNCPGGLYQKGTKVKLKAVATDPGFDFTGWTVDGDAEGGNNPLTVEMLGSRSVTANFQQHCYVLSWGVEPAGSGIVAASPVPNCGTDRYVRNTVVELKAVNNPAYKFGGWSDDVSGMHSPASITISSNMKVTANFVQSCYTLALAFDPPDSGGIQADPPPNCNYNTQYNEGTVVHLTPVPHEGYTFSEWLGDAEGAGDATVTMDGDRAVTAVFKAQQCYKLIYSWKPQEGGTVESGPPPNCSDDSYNPGTVVTLTAIPASGFTLDQWTEDVSADTPSIQVTMDTNHSVTAIFEKARCYKLSRSTDPSNGGKTEIVSSSPEGCGGDLYPANAEVSINAIPESGFEFAGWTGDASGGANPITVTMVGEQSVVAHFNPLCYSLTTRADPNEGGEIQPEMEPNCEGGRYQPGTVVRLRAVAKADLDYGFSGWQGDALGTNNPILVTMDGNKKVTAAFTRPACYTLQTASDPKNGGKVFAAPGPNCNDSTQYTQGTKVMLTAKPSPCYKFAQWTKDLNGTENPAQVTMDGSKYIIADFACEEASALPPLLVTGSNLPARYGLDSLAHLRFPLPAWVSSLFDRLWKRQANNP